MPRRGLFFEKSILSNSTPLRRSVFGIFGTMRLFSEKKIDLKKLGFWMFRVILAVNLIIFFHKVFLRMFKTLCSFWTLSRESTWSVPGLFIFAAFNSSNNKEIT